MIQFNRMPDVGQPLTLKGVLASGWFRFWQGLFSGTPTGGLSVLTVGSSPFTYIAPVGGSVIVNGGTTTQIKFSRDGGNFYITGLTAGMFPVSQGDQIVVTYSVGPPTMTFVPR